MLSGSNCQCITVLYVVSLLDTLHSEGPSMLYIMTFQQCHSRIPVLLMSSNVTFIPPIFSKSGKMKGNNGRTQVASYFNALAIAN